MRPTSLLFIKAMLLASVLSVVNSGTANAQRLEESRPTHTAAVKIDEYGRLYGCDHGARLDNFGWHLLQEPNAKAYVIGYDARARAPGTARAWIDLIRLYLVELRGIEESRIVTVYAGRQESEDIKTELWLVPPGVESPATRPLKEKPGAEFSGKFDTYYVYDSTVFYDVEGGQAGSFNIGLVFQAFTETLKRQKESQGYIVVYTHDDSDPGAWRRISTREQGKLTQEIGAERLTLINGGSKGLKEDDYGRVELWVGKKGDPPPVKNAKDNRKLTEAIMVGNLDFFADDDKIGGWVLNNLVEVMHADDRTVGCIIVHPPEEYGLVWVGEGVERPPIDIFKLAERWKAELLKKHGFDEQRIMILSGPTTFSNDGSLELWAVPHGAALPDPFASSEEMDVETSVEDPADPASDVVEDATPPASAKF